MKRAALILFVLSLCAASAQTGQDTTYQVELHTAAGALFSYFDKPRYNGAPDNVTFGYGINFRGMWHPGRMLAVGIMSGYSFISGDKIIISDDDGNKESISAQLAAIPLQAVISMQSRGFEFGLGIGSYLMLSTINFGKTAHGIRSELAVTFFTTYNIPLGKGIYIGPEIRAIYLRYRGIISIVPSLTVRFDTYRY